MGGPDAQVGLVLYMWGEVGPTGRRLQGKDGNGSMRKGETGNGVWKVLLGPTDARPLGLNVVGSEAKELLCRNVTCREQVPRRQKWQQLKWSSGI